ncbi:Protein indeterminate-domain 5, chloroplastic, partial [Cucurbita argyrosperma subsp. sororia]
MAASSSSSLPVYGVGEESTPQMRPPSNSSTKKKRNQPGTPSKYYPDAEVIALSPKTLMATNRFICEVCNKGFQREQNLQLHRRGHNLPWKLKQKSTKDPKRKVYLCPEPTCVHHHPSRALGDLTGIKKHYSRKHGEKKWKCDKCSKRYAVQSDWKAHSKTCGTREYRCDCGTLFSRRDSFITHRAFCDALAQESARHPPSIGRHLYGAQDHPNIINQSAPGHFTHLLPSSMGSSFRPMSASGFFLTEQNNQSSFHEDHPNQSQQGFFGNKGFHGVMQFPDMQSHTNNCASNVFNLGFIPNSTTDGTTNLNNNNDTNTISTNLNQFSATNNGNNEAAASNIFAVIGDQMNSAALPSLYSNASAVGCGGGSGIGGSFPHMSATALLQKAAQLGSTTSSSNTTSTLLRSFGSSSNSGGKASDRTLFPLSYGGVTFGEHESNLQDMMNSFGNGSSGSGMFGSGMNSFGGLECSSSRTNMETLEDPKLQQDVRGVRMGGTDRLTRDFLGVGQIVRSMSGGGGGGYSQKQGAEGMVLEGNERNSAPSSQGFGGGNGNYQ